MKTLTKILGVGGLLAALGGCSSPSEAVRAAEAQGWSNVNVTDSDYALNFTCGENEIAYRIEGLNPAGRYSEATVCCGWTKIKGCTIRY
ncbi:MAG: hypothetical protein PHO02_00550 [Candidatus Nanoarchaeia archaeon]|nr:hypothetical protein [Candidatus Nanoarchaeia archaeon]